jgi:lysozyme
MQNRNASNYPGIDISSNQTNLDFAAVKAAGIVIVYIKATEGSSYVNPYLKQHYEAAKTQGLMVGFYHYFQPASDPTQQAIFFANTIKDMSYDVIPMLDVEITGSLSARVLSTLVHECLNEINYLTQHIPVLYTYTAFAKDNLIADGISGYPFWPADYNNTGSPGYNGIWDKWIGYQYSEKGNIGGVIVDLDEFTSDILIGGEDDMKLAIEVAGVNTTLNGAPVANAVMLNVDGVDTAYIPDKVLRDAGFQVNWDAATQTVSITK